MINKIVRILKQEQGFTLMELMIVVVILGILAGIAIPTYNGVQDRARLAVGEANAAMLNRGIRQLEVYGYVSEDGTLLAIDNFDGEKDDHKAALKLFLEFDQDIEYVAWNSETGLYEANIKSEYEW